MPSRLTEIPDHLLWEIFLRLTAPADLARASAACVCFRRLVTERSFLRRFRRLHAPPLLGFRDLDGFKPALPPHPSAPAARALVLAADFSYSFLPSRCRWAVQDVRDGRVLLFRVPEQGEELSRFFELVVCDPLHQRYVLLPPVPEEDLAPSSAQHLGPRPQSRPFLAPLDDASLSAMEEETSFRVIYVSHYQTNLSALVFSSTTGQWRAAASKAWTDFFHLSGAELDTMSRVNPFFFRHHYAYGCFYWDRLVFKMKKLLVLDTRRMEFSVADLPPGEWSRAGLAFAEAGDGRLGVFGFRVGTASDLSSYTIAQNGGEGPSQWQMEKTISLDSRYSYCINDATGRYLLLSRTQPSSLENPPTEYFSMDLKTFKLQKVCTKQGEHTRDMYGTHIYTNFPPSLLSSPIV